MQNRFVRLARIADANGTRSVILFVLACALWSAFITCFVHALSDTGRRSAVPVALDARIVQLAPPPPAPVPHPTVRPAPAARPAEPRPVMPSRPAPLPHRSAEVPPRIATSPAPHEAPHTDLPAAPPSTSPPAARAGTANAAPESSSNGSSAQTGSADAGDGPAHAIVQPLPVLPDDLREEAYRAIALARFSIHPDGSVDVMLVKPTQNPRLNQLLLEALRNWRFFPAMKGGRPIESEQDIRVHFNVE